uniref:Non-LTR reverse transcriptase n=1 Tax=Solanum tuberosum TaxID=4113 RepID=M1BIU6_SOLTU
MEKYSITEVYGKMRGDIEKVEWRKLVWANYGAPKWTFILYIALHRRLSTKDRMEKWGIITDVTCPLCQQEDEDIDHLFFECNLYGTGCWLGKEYAEQD